MHRNSIDLLTKECHLPSGSTGIKSLATAVADLQHALKRLQDTVRNEALYALGKLTEKAFRIVRFFSGENFMNPISCIFPYLEKH